MKKKILLILPALLIPLFISGCSNGSKPLLTFGRYYLKEASSEYSDVFKVLTYSDIQQTTTTPAKEGLETKIKTKKETMLLATFQGEGSSCTCFKQFTSVVKYLNTDLKDALGKHYLVYLIPTTEFAGGKDTFGMKIPSSDTVTFSIFTNGTLTKQWLDEGTTADKLFTDSSVLAQRIEEYVSAPSIYLAENEETLDQLIQKTDKMVTYFGRTACPDCAKVNSLLLYPYLNNHPNKKLFMLDLDQYRFKEGMTKYQDIKDKYHLSTKYDEKLGYGEGVVPSFVYLEKAKYADEMVIYNDTVSKNEQNQYTITDSYYSKERQNNVHYLDNLSTKVLVGTVIPSEQIDTYEYEKVTYYSWKHEYATKAYEPFFNAFMDKYL